MRAYQVPKLFINNFHRPVFRFPCRIEKCSGVWPHIPLFSKVWLECHAGDKTWIPRRYYWNLPCVLCADTRCMDSRGSTQVDINAYILNARNRECVKPMYGIMQMSSFLMAIRNTKSQIYIKVNVKFLKNPRKYRLKQWFYNFSHVPYHFRTLSPVLFSERNNNSLMKSPTKRHFGIFLRLFTM